MKNLSLEYTGEKLTLTDTLLIIPIVVGNTNGCLKQRDPQNNINILIKKLIVKKLLDIDNFSRDQK